MQRSARVERRDAPRRVQPAKLGDSQILVQTRSLRVVAQRKVRRSALAPIHEFVSTFLVFAHEEHCVSCGVGLYRFLRPRCVERAVELAKHRAAVKAQRAIRWVFSTGIDAKLLNIFARERRRRCNDEERYFVLIVYAIDAVDDPVFDVCVLYWTHFKGHF
jgi:hypothetical protein